MKFKTMAALAGIALSGTACEFVVIDRSTSSIPGFSRCVEWPTTIGTSNYSNMACPDGKGNFDVTPTTVPPSYSSGIQPAPGRIERKFVVDPFRKKKE